MHAFRFVGYIRVSSGANLISCTDRRLITGFAVHCLDGIDVTHGIATNYVLRYCVRVRRLTALTIFSAFRRYDNFSIAI